MLAVGFANRRTGQQRAQAGRDRDLPALAAAALAVGVLGLLVERGLFRRFVGDEMGGMILSLALAITLQAVMALVFSVDEQSVRRPVEGAWRIGPAFFAKDQLLVAGVSVLALAAFYFLIERTRSARVRLYIPRYLREHATSPFGPIVSAPLIAMWLPDIFLVFYTIFFYAVCYSRLSDITESTEC